MQRNADPNLLVQLWVFEIKFMSCLGGCGSSDELSPTCSFADAEASAGSLYTVSTAWDLEARNKSVTLTMPYCHASLACGAPIDSCCC